MNCKGCGRRWLLATLSHCLSICIWLRSLKTNVEEVHSNVQKNEVEAAPCRSQILLRFQENQGYILPLVLYACETWSLTLREEHRLRAFENRVLRRIFRQRKDQATGGWRKLHNEELRDYS
jgi:hypothetical protein